MIEQVITRTELARLPEYSCSLPTGTRLGKRWRRDSQWAKRHHGRVPAETPPEWMIGEYYDIGSTERVGIKWAWAVSEPGSVHRGQLENDT